MSSVYVLNSPIFWFYNRSFLFSSHFLFLFFAKIRHLLGHAPSDLLSVLYHGTTGQYCVHEDIHQHGALDVLLLSQPPADHGGEVETQGCEKTVQHAIFTQALSVLPYGVAGNAESEDAETLVGETSKRGVLPLIAVLLGSHGYSL